jgi:hypothetical protein
MPTCRCRWHTISDCKNSTNVWWWSGSDIKLRATAVCAARLPAHWHGCMMKYFFFEVSRLHWTDQATRKATSMMKYSNFQVPLAYDIGLGKFNKCMIMNREQYRAYCNDCLFDTAACSLAWTYGKYGNLQVPQVHNIWLRKYKKMYDDEAGAI